MLVTVEDGRAVAVHGNPAHPPTHGALCTKVSRYPERTYHPDRVLRPLKRVGPKGSGRFAPVAWDEALDDIAARLRTIAGPDLANAEAIVPYSYCGTMGLVQGESMAGRFFHRLGASLLDRTICSSAGGEALAATYGAKVGMHVEHYVESRLIVIWGSNSITSNLHFWRDALVAKRAGARLVCIDPRRTETAEHCHEHIALLPGSDGALALGVMHELIANDWLDHDYIERHVDGWPALRERALAWPAERAAAACGIDAAQVQGARARLRHDPAGGDPPQLRHAARARRRQRDAADRDPAVPRRRVAAPRRRAAAVGVGMVRAGAQRPRAAAPRPARRPHAAHDQHEHDRRRPACASAARSAPTASASGRGSRRSSSTTATRSRSRPSRRRSRAASRARISSPSSSSTS